MTSLYFLPSRSTLLCMLCLFFVVFIFETMGEDVNPRYVDINEAQVEISSLEASNQIMVNENDRLEEENQSLATMVSQKESLILQANEILERLSASAGEIYTMQNTIVDPDMRRMLQQRMIDNRQQRYDLESRKRMEQDAINTAQGQIENNQRIIALNRVRIKNNELRIEYLQACIDLSVNEAATVDSILANADAVQAEVERLLNQH